MQNVRSTRYANPATTHTVQVLDAAAGMLRSGRVTPQQLVVAIWISRLACRAAVQQ